MSQKPKSNPTPTKSSRSNRLLRLPEVLARIPISKSTWWAGVKKGAFPKPRKLGARVCAWREQDIDALCGQGEG
jgi:prophage regulatory protein